MHSKQLTVFILLSILVGAFVVRLHGFSNPIADWHSWRQADTSAVSRNFAQNGFDLLKPKFDDLSNVPSKLNNPEGYRFVEFPLYNALQAGLFKTIGLLTIEQWGRIVSMLASLLSITFLYKLVAKYTNKTAGLLVAFFYAFLPFNIFYGRTILPDPSMVAASLGGIYFFSRAFDPQEKHTYCYYVLSLLSTIAALLLKPYAVFFMLPILSISYLRFGFTALTKPQLWVYVIASCLPLIGWRAYITQFPEGVPSNSWLLNGNGIRFRPAFFRWLGYERLTRLILGFVGTIFLPFGLYEIFREKQLLLYGSFLVSSLLYVIVFATGNVQHDYYQILIMPSVALVCGLGAYFLITDKRLNRKFPLGKIVFMLLVIGSFYFSWHQVKDYFNINNYAIVTAGKAVDKLIPKDAKIIANYNGDTSFLYQTKRKGWASFQHSLPEMVKLGADYLVLVNPTLSDVGIGTEYKILKKTPEYLLFDLKQKP